MEHLDISRKRLIMLAIMAAMLFASINQTIVGTALPKIISHLGGMEYYSWVFTIYILASSITAILVGKLSDIYGRKIFILIGIGVFTVGSFLCGLSQSTIQLIAFRALQGLGAGMIMSTSFTAIGDLFVARERGKWTGLMSSVFGISSVFGPTFGGWLVDNADWHWVFWVFLPFGIIAFLMIFYLFPTVERKKKEKIDFLGSIMLTLTIIPLLLAFTLGGQEYKWVSPQVIGLVGLVFLFLCGFIMVEKKAESPVLPLHLFRNRMFTITNMVTFIAGIGMFCAIMYMPFFIQGVMGTSAAHSGMIMMSQTLSMVFASTIGGSLISKTGRYKWFAVSGLFIMGVGIGLLGTMGPSTPILTAVLFLILLGFGLGLCNPIFSLAIQNAVSHRYLGVATASNQLFRQLGGTLGVGIMGSFLNTIMAAEIKKNLAGITLSIKNAESFETSQALLNQQEMNQYRSGLSLEMQKQFDFLLSIVRDALSTSLTTIFLTSALIILLGVVLAIFMVEIPLNERMVSEKNNDE